MVPAVELSGRAIRDLRRIGPGPERKRILTALEALADGAPNLDVKALQGCPPWLRLRAGDYRVLYRPLPAPPGPQPSQQRLPAEGASSWWVERVVHRRELEQAVGSL